MTHTPRIVFIAGTDTNTGKTAVTAGLLKALADAGVQAQAIKAVQTGCDGRPDGSVTHDAARYAEAAPASAAHVLHSFVKPCSPHLAAAKQQQTLHAAEIAGRIRELARNAEVTLVEGSGGLFVPLNSEETVLDLPALLDAPVVLVVANRLGAVNHALLSLEALRSRGVDILGLVFTEVLPALDAEERDIRADNVETIARLGQAPVCASIPFIRNLQEADVARRRTAWAAIARCLSLLAERVTARCASDAAHAASGNELLAFDRRHLWHPYTSAVRPLPVWEAAATRNHHIRLRDGARLVDGMASWWSAIHGYNHPSLQKALIQQALRMPHVMFGGLTHAPAVALGRTLLRLAPSGLNRVFFADSGSVAVEVAIKMAVQYQQARGKAEKSACMAFLGGYHGDTLGAMSVCDPVNGMHSLFQRILPKQLFVDRPECAFGAEWQTAAADCLKKAFAQHASKTAAFILEPIVQGAGGMWFYHPEYLRLVRALCDEHDVLLIADEIATGFGRTGKMFACEWGGVLPDILCVGKALTGGTMSLAATLATEHVALGISEERGVLMHGPTFMANPLACAVASASLDLLENSPWRDRIAAMRECLEQGLAPCSGLPDVADVRVLGGIGVVEMRRPVNVARLQEYFVSRWGVWIRPFAGLIYVMPPYTTPCEDIALLARAIVSAVKEEIWK